MGSAGRRIKMDAEWRSSGDGIAESDPAMVQAKATLLKVECQTLLSLHKLSKRIELRETDTDGQTGGRADEGWAGVLLRRPPDYLRALRATQVLPASSTSRPVHQTHSITAVCCSSDWRSSDGHTLYYQGEDGRLVQHFLPVPHQEEKTRRRARRARAYGLVYRAFDSFAFAESRVTSEANPARLLLLAENCA